MTAMTPAYAQTHFRIRLTDDQGLNAAFDAGDPAEDANATIDWGIRFRVRFKIAETAGNGGNNTFKLQYNRNSGGWNDLDVQGGNTATPIVVEESLQYANDDATSTELLTTSARTYINGVGTEDNSVSSTIDNEDTEIEFCLFMHSFWDNWSAASDGDTIQLRIVEGDSTAFGTYDNTPTITLNAATGYIGGAISENPAHVGPFMRSNGDMYLISEPSESDPEFGILRSTDGGDTWSLQDDANAPTAEDLEGIDAYLDGDDLRIIHHEGDTVYYHEFATDTNTWTTIDEQADGTTLGAFDQFCALATLSDGSLWAFYSEGGTGSRIISYKKRTSGGTWDVSSTTLDTDGTVDWAHCVTVVDDNDLTHIFYSEEDNGNGYHRSLSSGGTLSGRESFASNLGTSNDDQQPMLPPVWYLDGSDRVVMCVFKVGGADDKLYHVTVTNDGTPSSQTVATDNTVTMNLIAHNNRQPTAYCAVDSKKVYVVYSESASQDIYLTTNDDLGGWTTDTQLQASTWQAGGRGQGTAVTHSAGNGGDKVLAMAIDTGSDGYTGFVEYFEYVIPSNKMTQGIRVSSRTPIRHLRI